MEFDNLLVDLIKTNVEKNNGTIISITRLPKGKIYGILYMYITKNPSKFSFKPEFELIKEKINKNLYYEIQTQDAFYLLEFNTLGSSCQSIVLDGNNKINSYKEYKPIEELSKEYNKLATDLIAEFLDHRLKASDKLSELDKTFIDKFVKGKKKSCSEDEKNL